MKAVWITKSFLDYRIPVYEEVSKCFEGHFVLIFNADYVPARCYHKVQKVLGVRARGLRGEWALKVGPQKGFANKGIRIPYQHGLVGAALDEHPDVLISDGFFQWTYAALWLRASRGIPHVMCYEKTLHTERNAQWYRTAYRRLSMRWIDAMCCNGRLCAEYVQRLGFPASRITYGHMVADLEGMHKGAGDVTDQGIADVASRHRLEGAVFIYVGRLIPLKGLRQLLDAWRQFVGGPAPCDVTLLIVGDGPEKESLRKYCVERGLDSVRFLGEVDYDALPRYYRCADAFIIPTLEDNWSLVVPEAMACGLPILCSKYNGCWPELVTDGNGWVFDPLSPQDTVRVLREASASKARLVQMGEQSRAIVGGHSPKHAAESIYKACEMACRIRLRHRPGRSHDAEGPDRAPASWVSHSSKSPERTVRMRERC